MTNDDGDRYTSEDFKRLESKIDDVSEHCWSIDKKQLVMNQILDEHQRRSKALEDQVSPMLELKAQIKGCINLIYVVAAFAAIIECVRLFIK